MLKRIVKIWHFIINKNQTYPIIMPNVKKINSVIGTIVENVYKITTYVLIILISKAYYFDK